MPGLSDTAYPRLKPNPSAKELDDVYTPNLFEGSWVEQRTREPVPRIGLLALLKTFQRLGYFVMLDEVPRPILQHIAQSAGYEAIPDGLGTYDASSVRRRHMALVRDYVGVSTWCEAAQKIMADACRDAARTRDDLADIINVALEELVRQRYELPAFNTILRAARAARSEVNQGYYSRVRERLSDTAIATLAALLARPPEGAQSSWDRLKNEPKQATTQRTRDFLEHLEWLRQQSLPVEAFAGVPDIKVKQFAAEARSLDLGSIHDCADPKRLTLTAALVVVQTARALDDVADMFIRLVQKLHNHAYDALLQHQADHVDRTDSLVATLQGVTLAYRSDGSVEARLNAIGAVLEPDADRILAQCEAHEATSGRNYLPFLTRFYSHQRSVLFRFLERVDLVSTSPSTGTLDAVVFLLAHKADRHDWLPIVRDEPRSDGSTEQVALADLSMVTEKWWPVVTGSKNLKTPATRVLRRPFELCVLTEVMQDLRSGDLSIPGSDRYSDYRGELVTEEEFQKGLASYGEKAGIPVEAAAFVSSLKERLAKAAAKADEGFPTNEYLSVEGGEATLKRLRRKPEPTGLKRFEKLVKERMEPVGILETLSDTQDWLNWTRHFGPISGNDPKLENPTERYLVTTFCYGFDFGPTQTSRSIRGLDRRQVAFVNQRHVTEETLNEAITTVVNGYSQCELTKVWGLGKSASGDGTKWDLSPQNLMSQYHIRYGGYGGIGYYLVSDLYIALFSRFTTCGSWEGHHILDFIHENMSDVQPDTIHADTQGQSAAIFGLAYLLGIQLQPRIRNWKNLHFFRPDPEVRYKHIDLLFTKQVEWSLIETMRPEMLRVALSISAGRIKPSTILRRLATYSRKNKLYFAFRELGRVVRTAFLRVFLNLWAIQTAQIAQSHGAQ